MKSHPSRFEMIANQMMKGTHSSCAKNGRANTQELMNVFQKRYYNTIKYVEENIPKSVSVGVCGAIGKAILWYGKDKIEPFAMAFNKRNYNGIYDPVHVLWEWLLRNSTRKHYAREIYQRTITAIRAYLRKGKINSGKLVPAADDIFEWDEDYKNMIQPKRNQYAKFSSKSNKRQTEESVLEEVDSLKTD